MRLFSNLFKVSRKSKKCWHHLLYSSVISFFVIRKCQNIGKFDGNNIEGKKRFGHSCFPVNSAKFLRTPFLQITSGWLLFRVVLQHFIAFDRRVFCYLQFWEIFYFRWNFFKFNLFLFTWTSENGKFWNIVISVTKVLL